MATGRDIIAQAQSGTGKTGTFSVGLLAQLDTSRAVTQALVLSPTRELAAQTRDTVLGVGGPLGATVHVCVGGTSVAEDVAALRKGVHVVVGTPGRVLHMLGVGALSPTHLRTVVLDEADQLLDVGFKDQIYEVFQAAVTGTTQVALFSATMPQDALALAGTFMRDPAVALIQAAELTLENLKQFFVLAQREEDKFGVLANMFRVVSAAQTVIFTSSRRRADWLAARLTDAEFTCSVLHGAMEQEERARVMREFRTGASRVLVATDLVARGIDVQQVSLVINFELPHNRENYIHRIGRSARFGRQGVAINIITPDEVPMLKDIEAHYHTQVPELSATDV